LAFVNIHELASDARYGWRTLRRNPSFAVVAVLSLAFGIGANTLIFSIVNSLVLEPLPVADPDRVVFVQNAGASFVGVSFPNYRDLRDRQTTMAGLAAYRISPMNVDTGGSPARRWGYLATGNYFDVLGVTPALGRFFHAADDQAPGNAPVAVLAYSYWLSRFAADPAVIGRTIRINRLPFTVIGVAPPRFRGTERFYHPDIWVPMTMQAQIEVGNPWLEARSSHNPWIVGRLGSGMTREAAQINLNVVAAELAREYPQVNEGLRFKLASPGFAGDALGAPVKAFTLGLLGLAALVLLVACANLASLLAARGADRHRELAIRLSIGAARARIVQQLLTESLLLSVIGGAVGCGIAAGGAALLSGWRAPVDFPVHFDIVVNRTVLLFALAVSVLTGLLFGVAPARRASMVAPGAIIKDRFDGTTRWRCWPVRDLLVGVQVALCFVLLAASFLSLRGLQQALTLPLGLDPRGVTIVGFELGLAGYSAEDGRRFQQHALKAVQSLPGVEAAAYGNSVPLSVDQSSTTLYNADRPMPRPSQMPSATRYQVSPGYFRALGTRLLRGRDIDWRDTSDRPRVAVVNAAFARTILDNPNAVGARVRYGRSSDVIEVIGIVEDGKYTSLTEPRRPAIFLPMEQSYNTTTTMIVRSPLPPEQMVAAVRAAIATLDPELPLYGTGTLAQMLGLVLFPNRAAALALTAFGFLAVVLAATGIHGTVAYAVARRRREIGIRIAVGASTPRILAAVLGRTMLAVALGSLAGLALALGIAPLLSNVIYQVAPRDPITFLTVAIVLGLVAAVSCCAPARQSLRIAPVDALRAE
jgi:predicted permease